MAIFLVVILNKPSSSGISASSLSATDQPTSANPLDQVSSTDIALTIAEASNLPETTAIANQAQTAAANISTADVSDNVITKPEVISTALKSKADISYYTSKPGDTVSSLAAKFGITSDSITWSNGLTSANINPGTKLIIPPVSGIVYTVKPGDTPQSVAAKYNANISQVIAYNDAEVNGLTPGEQIIIPNGTLAVSTSHSSSSGTSFPWGNGPIYGYNGYDYGYCTWYVATQIPVPSNWGQCFKLVILCLTKWLECLIASNSWINCPDTLCGWW